MNGEAPAYPVRGADGTLFSIEDCKSHFNEHCATGMTKREAFAMAAPEPPDWFMTKRRHHAQQFNEEFDEGEAWFAWRTFYADALIKALNGK